jgi:putative ABC transport system permease protein
VDGLLHDLRYALRLIRRGPGAAIVALLTMAVGVGANAAIFSIIRAVLLAPPPFRNPERLVELTEQWPNLPGPRPISTLNYRDWADQSTVFDRMAAVSWGSVTVSDGPQPVYVDGSVVSPSYFELFGLHAALGRTFAPDEDQPGRAHVVVLSHRLWVSQFGSDPSVVGRSIRLDGAPYTVIGVMPSRTSVRFIDAQLWRPLTYDWVLSRSLHDLAWAAARLKPGVTLERARAEMDTIAARLARAYPESNTDYGVRVEAFPRPMGFDVATSLYLLFGAVGVVLLIGCVNLANLALARGAARSREVAIRTALGAGRGRLVRQFLTEHIVIALAGGCGSLVIGRLLLQIAHVAIPTTGLRAAFPADTLIAMDGPVWLFALGLSVSSGVGLGLLPAIGATRVPLTEVIKSSGPNVSAGRAQRMFRQLLIAGEVALAFMLVTGAGLLIQSFFVLTSRVESGYDATNVLTAGLPIPPTRYESAATSTAISIASRAVFNRCRESATWPSRTPARPKARRTASSFRSRVSRRCPSETGRCADSRS